MKISNSLVIMVLLMISPLAVMADEGGFSNIKGTEIYHFDKAHTNIMWFADHIGFSRSLGQFMDYDGKIELNFDHPDQSSVMITLKTASVMTGQPKFDDHLKSADFFDVEKYPTARFVSKKITLGEGNNATVEGDFTLLGVTKSLTLQIQMNKRAMDITKNIRRVGFSGKAIVKRSRWGMKKYLPFIGDDVIMRFEAEALITP